MASNRGRKRNVAFNRPDEPSFIKKLKAQCGYIESADVETKRDELPQAKRSDIEDKDDEQPAIVTLKKGDISEEEYLKLKELAKDIDKKIVFRKPDKQQAEDKSKNVSVQSSFSKNNDNDISVSSRLTSSSESKRVKNTNLLSFGEDEEDED